MSDPSEDVVPKRRRWLSTWEFVAIVVIVAIGGLLLPPFFARQQEAARRASCQDNLRQWGVAFRMYVQESKGERYPPLAPYATAPTAEGFSTLLFSAPDAGTLYPAYVTDLGIARCPSDVSSLHDPHGGLPDDFRGYRAWQDDARAAGDTESLNYFLTAEMGQSYVYRGYAMVDEEEFNAWWGATTASPVVEEVEITGVGKVWRKRLDGELNTLGEAWPPWVPRPRPQWIGLMLDGGSPLPLVYPLITGIERFYWPPNKVSGPAITGHIKARIPLIGDALYVGEHYASFNHAPGGSNVLFLDGHVEFVRYPAEVPMQAVQALLDRQTEHESRTAPERLR
jgi:prepilin-type processing-associated H-X9-DG protein